MPRTPLWLLVLAAQLVDIAWAILVFAGVEQLRLDPSLASNSLVLHYMPFTHGLPAAAIWASATFVVVRLVARDNSVAVVAAVVVGTHWLLDLIVHRPDLPLWGDSHKVGLALWDLPAMAVILEFGLFLGAAIWLLRSPAIASTQRRKALAWFVGGLLLMGLAATFAPQPADTSPIVASMLTFFIVAAVWAHRVENNSG